MESQVYHYTSNMHIIDSIIDSLMLTRITEEIKEYDKAFQIVMLKMFPCENPQADIIEALFKDYANDHTVEEWYNSLFKNAKPIIKKQ